MTSDQVGSYLQQHPEFFEQHADLLADIYIPHPHGGRAIPISERQILTLRERCKQLEAKLREVLQFGEENDAIGEKVHRLMIAVLNTDDLETLKSTIGFNLREDFAVPHVALRTWQGEGEADAADVPYMSDATRDYVSRLTHPYCGAHVLEGTSDELFGEAAPQLKSFSIIPLRSGETFGVLALASEDPQRFYPEMGTVYLTRIGEMAGTALLRHLRA